MAMRIVPRFWTSFFAWRDTAASNSNLRARFESSKRGETGKNRKQKMYNLVFNAFGIALTAVAIYGVMNGQIADGICFGFGAVAMALIANFVEAKSI
jgi:hypothetical protein